MIIAFEKEYLRVLYEEGRCVEKKHRFQPDIIRRYQKAIGFLVSAPSIESLWKINSLNFEYLSGDKTGLCSVRVNNQYRIEFSVSVNNQEPMFTICNIIDLSNHYK